jgi:heme/copper-type cytochrome/quinol oxidase subunit 1
MTVIPMLWLGYCGHPRRVLDYPYVFGGWHSISSAGHFLSVIAILSFFSWYMIVFVNLNRLLEIILV